MEKYGLQDRPHQIACALEAFLDETFSALPGSELPETYGPRQAIPFSHVSIDIT